MELDEQLAMLRPTIEVENLVRAIVARRSVQTARRGDRLTISRPGSDAAALTCYPAVVQIAVDPARARALEGSLLVERIESKTAATSFVWVASGRLRTEFDEAVTVALEAVDRKARTSTAARTTTGTRTAATRTRVASPAAPPPPEPKICPRCGLQISAAGTCFCD